MSAAASRPIERDDPKVARARAMFPEESAALDAYNDAIQRTAQLGKAKLGADRTQRRIGQTYNQIKDMRTMEQKLQDEAAINHGKALISAADPLEDYKAAVWAAYGSSIGNNEALTLSVIAHRYGLNPNPGLNLVYGWKQDGKFRVEISYKGWLALAYRFKQFIHAYRRLSKDEVLGRGGKEDWIIVECEAVDLTIAEKLKLAKSVGFEIDVNKYKVTGYGVFKPGDNIPKGRDAEWVAKKRATKDMAAALIAEAFNINMPELPGTQYNRETGQWEMETEGKDELIEEVSAAASEMVVEGEYTEAAKEATPVVEQKEAVDITPEPSEPEVKAETEQPASETEASVPEVAALRDLQAIYEAGKLGTDEIAKVPEAKRIVAMLQNVVKPQMSQDAISGAIKKLITNSTLNHVTTEEYRGLLAVINAAPTADEVKALIERQAATPAAEGK